MIFTLLFLQDAITAQNSLDKLMVERTPNCNDIRLNCEYLINKYYATNTYDSIDIISDYWLSKCNEVGDLVQHIKLLNAIRTHKFTEQKYDTVVNNYITDLGFMNSSFNHCGTSILWFHHNSSNLFIKRYATDLLKNQSPDSIEYMVCQLFSDDVEGVFKNLQNTNTYKNSLIKKNYINKVNKCVKMIELNRAIVVGSWMPLGNLNIFGTHPLVGFEIGAKKWNTYFNINLGFSFLQASSKYYFVTNNSLVATKYHIGIHSELSVEPIVKKINYNDFIVIGGVGGSQLNFGIVNTKNKNTLNDTPKSAKTIVYSIGLGYKRNVSKKNARYYYGINAKYNLANFKNMGGTNLSGNFTTLTLLLGFNSNENKKYALHSLHYYNY